MRKIFTTLKSVVAATVIAAMTLAASCSYDDSAIAERVDRVEEDLAALTERVAALEQRLSDEVTALTALINGKVVVTAVEEDGNGTKVTLSDGTSFTVYPECTVVDTDTNTNVYITVQKDTDGVLYFAIYENDAFKEWLLVDGEKVPVHDGNDDTQDDNVCDNPYEPVVPQFRTNMETGNIEVSIDGGATWYESGLTAAATGGQLFTGVVVNEDGTVTFVLADDSRFDVVLAELIEFSGRGHVYVKAEEVKDVALTVNDAVVDINVLNQPLGWKATVELAPVEEETGDEVDPGMGVLAAGGTNYIVKVTGPSKNLVREGIAEKSGYIQIHFNTAVGACKVAKLAVDLAELTLDVDKQGNITITNSLVTTYEYQDWWTGEVSILTDFNNFYAGVMPLDSYSGNLKYDISEAWKDCAAGYNTNYGWYEGFFAADGTTMYEAAYYEDGVTEMDVLKTTVQAYVDNFSYGAFGFEGESFVVFAMPVDMNTGDQIWDEAIIVEFKQPNINVVEREDLRSFNMAYFDATMRGCVAYQINIESVASLENMITDGWYTSEQEYYETALYYWSAYNSSFGQRITVDVNEEGISMLDLYNYETPYITDVPLTPGTAYKMAILPEIDGKAVEEYTYEDIVFVEFSTADIVKAEPAHEYTIVEDLELKNYYQIAVEVTVPENTATAYSAWVSEAFLEEAEALEYLYSNGWAKTDFESGYSYKLSRSTENPGEAQVLVLLIVDENGTYTFVQQEFKSTEVVYNEAVLTIESVEFANGAATVTVGGLEGLEWTELKSYICDTEAYSYYLYDEAKLQNLAYKSDYRYGTQTENPFVLTQGADYNAVAEGKTYRVAVAAVFADGSVTVPVVAEYEYAAAEPAGPIVFTSAAYTGDVYGAKQLTFTAEDGTVVTYGMILANNYLEEKFYNYVYASDYNDEAEYVHMNGSNWPGFDIAWAIFTMDVKIVDGKYNITLKATHDAQVAEGTYVGDIEGFEYPAGGNEGGGDEGGETTDGITFTAASARQAGSSWTDMYVDFTYDNMRLQVNFFNVAKNQETNALRPGTYQVGTSGSCVYGGGYTATYINEEKMYNYDGGYITISNEGDVYTFDINLTCEDNTLVGTYTGTVEGLVAPAEVVITDPIALDVYHTTCSYYSEGSEYEICFYYHTEDGGTKMFQIDFGVAPLVAGTYSIASGTIFKSYSKFDGEMMSECEVVVTDNGDGTLTFDAAFKDANGQPYTFVYTGVPPTYN